MPLSTGAKVGIGLGVGAAVLGIGTAVLYSMRARGMPAPPLQELAPGLHQVEVGRKYILKPVENFIAATAAFGVKWANPDGTEGDPAGNVLAALSANRRGVEVVLTESGTAAVTFAAEQAFGMLVTEWILNAGGSPEGVALLEGMQD